MLEWFLWIALPLGAIVLIIGGTVTKSNWGINLRGPRTCPGCGRDYARPFRKPASFGEALWGGRTCGNCGTRVDKWGRRIGEKVSAST